VLTKPANARLKQNCIGLTDGIRAAEAFAADYLADEAVILAEP
jgi:hypothetical protein